MSLTPDDISLYKMHKKRYLIAVYDKDDYLIDVAFTVNGLKIYKEMRNSWGKKRGVNSLNANIRSQMCHDRKKFFLVDCFEKHNDVFAEEDELFLKYMEEECDLVDKKKVLAKEGVADRTFYAKARVFKQHEKKGGDNDD